MISLDEARAHVLDRVRPLAAVRVPLREAHGCVLAAPVVAADDVPPFANTAMDGFAVRSADVAAAPVVLDVVATVAAGHAPEVEVGPGQAARIFTGAPIPAGADAVVMVERTKQNAEGTKVEVLEAVPAGNHIRNAGDDLPRGTAFADEGQAVTPGMVGLLASAGAVDVEVYARPRVGVLSTGDELVEAPKPLAPGQIRDSNRHALLALVSDSGFEPVDLGLARDDEQAITDAIEDAVTRCDAVLTTGGVSMGDIDLVKVVLDRLGDMRWMQIAIKPAKPFAFGTVRSGDREVPVFGLPGNPVSSMVSYELLARPALRRMAGHPTDRLDRPVVDAVAAEALRRRPDGKTHFVRVAVWHDGQVLHARSGGPQASHQLSSMARSNALAILDDGDGVGDGETVKVMVLGDVPSPRPPDAL